MKRVSLTPEEPNSEELSGIAASRRAVVGGSVASMLASLVGGNRPAFAHGVSTVSADDIYALWPEIEWISDPALKSKTVSCWENAFRLSNVRPADLYDIPFSIRIPDCPVNFNAHKRCVAIVAYKSAKEMLELFEGSLQIDLDVVLAGAILADVGKLLEYEMLDGKAVMSQHGKLVRHAVSGAHLAMDAGLPDSVVHIVATHSGEGDLSDRSTESWIVHHADFMCTDPFIAIARRNSLGR